MAKSEAVWGIEIGHSALKALRCKPNEDDPSRIEADAFDFIEYPQLLSEPEADADSLIDEALQQFLSRNTLKGDAVAISVPGQKGLAKFVKLPPVESSKIPDMVRYEAKQQIPFPLGEVIWDYQQMAGGSEEAGFSLETEVGLFAMKREEVLRQMAPYERAEVEIDIVQLTPLALYNFLAYDQLQELPSVEHYDPEDPPPSVVILSLGCETTEMVVTDGFRVWPRSMPIGGNHFTRALKKQFNLTFAKAEHLKRNATSSQHAKQIFQAMRPVFDDLVGECQRSLRFFQNLHKEARISHVVALGNVMKLPGLRTYLEQHLKHKVTKLDGFRRLAGSAVAGSPQFKENILSFAACYGLCLQHLTNAPVTTNLVPQELLQDRLVNAKKPWAVVAAATLLLGFSVSTLFHWRAWSTVSPTTFGSAVQVAENNLKQANGSKSTFQTQLQSLTEARAQGYLLVQHALKRGNWSDFYRTLYTCLPQAGVAQAEAGPADDPLQYWKLIGQREAIYINRIEVEWCEDLAEWYSKAKGVAEKEFAGGRNSGSGLNQGEFANRGNFGMQPGFPRPGFPQQSFPGTQPGGVPGGLAGQGTGEEKEEGPSGAGWVVQVTGYHYHNNKKLDPRQRGYEYLRNTLLANLSQWNLLREGQTIEIGQAGIGYPLIVKFKNTEDYNPEMSSSSPTFAVGSGGTSSPGGRQGGQFMEQFPSPELNQGIPRGAEGELVDPIEKARREVRLPRFDFQLQFVWKDYTAEEKAAATAKKLEEEKKAQEAAQAAQGGSPNNPASITPTRSF